MSGRNAPTRTTAPRFISVATLPQVHWARRVFAHRSASRLVMEGAPDVTVDRPTIIAKYATACGLDIYDAGLGLVVVHKGIVPISCPACTAALDTSLANH